MIEDLFDKISDCLSEGLSELTSSTDIASSEILHSIKDINEDSFSSILDSDSLSETEILKYLDDFEDKESVLTQNDISFGSHPYNSYDDNTADFLKKCAQYDISLPPNIDHSHIQGDYLVNRSYYGGLPSIDKSIIQDTLKKSLDSGNLSEDDYNDLIKSLRKC